MRERQSLPLVRVNSGMVAAVCLPIILPRVAVAASRSFVVTSTGDASDASPGNGLCATSAGDCTLRAAVEEADAQATGSTITITVPAGTYSLTLGALALTANTITITGAMSSTTIVDAGGLSGVFTVSQGVSASLNGLTISDGGAATGGRTAKAHGRAMGVRIQARR
jgi:CSLREA domain-containing protein